MIIELVLTNFGNHENKTIQFAEGFNVIRGKNESGKSTIFSALLYAWWGVRALGGSFEDYVTWGRSPSSMSVKLRFSHVGVVYTLTRSKSGASIVGSNGVTAEGQTEVANFVSALFKATQSVAQATMVIGQKSITDTLGKTSQLVETLAEVDLIEKLVRSVQTHLPSGNTKAVEKQLADLGQVSAEPMLRDYTQEQEAFEALTMQFSDAKDALAGMEAMEAGWRADLAAGQSALVEYERAQARRLADLAEVERLKSVAIVRHETVDLEPLYAAQAEQARINKLVAAREAFKSYSLPSTNWPDKEHYKADRARALDSQASLSARIAEHDTAIAVAQSQRITDTVCGLCQKDLTDVPEVVQKNEILDSRISLLKENLILLKGQKENEVSAFRIFEIAEECSRRNAALLSRFSDCVSTVPGFPERYVLSQESETAVADSKDYAKELVQAKSANTLAAESLRTAQAHVSKLEAIEERLAVNIEAPSISNTTLSMLKEQLASLESLRKESNILYAKLSDAQAKLKIAKAERERDQRAWDLAKAQHDSLTKQVTDMGANNTIIRKLREARPVVVQELWNLVLHIVQDYFSDVRGQLSVVTRDEDGFLIDGKRAERYSGSTQDALGWANRVALQKVFLGDVDFMLLDESGAAMDANREIQLIASAANADFKQVIMITHSSLADTFATNLIEL